jgi:recombination protein RecT|tara:strand:- start:873 stop:1982 length:1110 start_codon:yes stop_codon:yes gene_type:complete
MTGTAALARQEAQDQKIQTVGQYLLSDSFKNQLKLALPKGMTADRMARIALTEVRRTPKLADCTIESLMGAVMECAQLGLEPGPLGLANIIPYGRVATFQIGYKGLLQLIWRSNRVKAVYARRTFAGDEFDENIGERPIHKKGPNYEIDEHADGVYATIATTAGGWITEWWPKHKIEAHRDRYSQAYRRDKRGTPWTTAPESMWRKTVLKQAGKLAPISAEAHRAIALDDLAEADQIDADLLPAEPNTDMSIAAVLPGGESGEGEKDSSTPNAREAAKIQFYEAVLECGLDEDVALHTLVLYHERADARALKTEDYQSVLVDTQAWADFRSLVVVALEERKPKTKDPKQEVAGPPAGHPAGDDSLPLDG